MKARKKSRREAGHTDPSLMPCLLEEGEEEEDEEEECEEDTAEM